MNRLTKLANRHKTDKGTEYWYAHGFTEFYEPYFRKYENPTILDIGTAEGASARMLNDYYDGECTIYTIDVDENCEGRIGDYDNIHFHRVDTRNLDSIQQFLDSIPDVKFDIIIEDAAHDFESQMKSLAVFSRRLKKDGVYVLEDIHTSYYAETEEKRRRSTLYYLNFFEDTGYLSNEDRQDLTDRIKDIIIFNRYNEKNYEWFDRSITSIITFDN